MEQCRAGYNAHRKHAGFLCSPAFSVWIDAITKNGIPLGSSPPYNIAVIRFREREMPERILVCTIGGPHASLVLELADIQARRFEAYHWRPAVIALFSVVPPEQGEHGLARRRELLHDLVEARGLAAEFKVVAHPDVFQAIVDEVQQHNLVMVNAPREGFFGATAVRIHPGTPGPRMPHDGDYVQALSARQVTAGALAGEEPECKRCDTGSATLC
jgi:hypothetical protein